MAYYIVEPVLIELFYPSLCMHIICYCLCRVDGWWMAGQSQTQSAVEEPASALTIIISDYGQSISRCSRYEPIRSEASSIASAADPDSA